MFKKVKDTNENMRTAIMSLVFITHVTTVIVPITNPGRGNASAIVTPELIRVAGSDLWGCRHTMGYSKAYKTKHSSSPDLLK